jgi:hypothetical protein
MIPDYSLALEHIHPLSYDTFIREVLIPEAALHLIQGDLVTDRQSAIDVLHDSQSFGNMMHPSDDDSQIVMETT